MKITTNVNKCRFVWCRTFFCRALYSAIDRSRHQTATWFWRWIYFLKLFSFWSHTAPSSFCHTFIQSGYRVCFSRNNFGISKVLIYWCDDCIIFVLIRLNVFLKIFFFLVFFGESKSGWLFFVQISQYFEKQKSYVRNWSEHLLSSFTNRSIGSTEIYHFDRFNYFKPLRVRSLRSLCHLCLIFSKLSQDMKRQIN